MDANILVLLFAVLFALVIRRTAWSPLRSIPGPFLAAISGLYRAWYDIVGDGAFTDHLQVLHRQYGPVVRVGPNEIHFSSPHAYTEIYTAETNYTKEPSLYNGFHFEESCFGYIDPAAHKQRQKLILPLFSRRAILKLEGIIQAKVEQFLSRLMESDTVYISLALKSLTVDIIDQYLFAESDNALGASNFNHSAVAVLKDSVSYFWINKHFPAMLWIMDSIPSPMLAYVSPQHLHTRQHRRELEVKISHRLTNPEASQNQPHETVYRRLLSADTLPSVRSLVDEAQDLHFAGSDTTGNVCVFAVFHVMESPGVYQKLIEALREAWPDPQTSVTLEVLEKIPYLTGVIKEGLRHSLGTSCALLRVVGNGGGEIQGYRVPSGTVVGTSAVFVHMDPTIFSNPTAFIPERWLQSDSAELEQFLVTFSKGPRACIGRNLAWAELYLILGNLFRRVDMELYQTTQEDMKAKDYFTPVLAGEVGVRVLGLKE